MRPKCPIRGNHGAHCPRIPNARLATCESCPRLLLLSYWYPLLRRPSCLVCQRELTTATTDTTPFQADRTPAGRLRAAEATMRLRTLAAGHTYTGRTDAAYTAEAQRARDAPGKPGDCATLSFGGQQPILAGYARGEVA